MHYVRDSLRMSKKGGIKLYNFSGLGIDRC